MLDRRSQCQAGDWPIRLWYVNRTLPHLYRFRSTRALLDEFCELERQEIYFSNPEELNDPMETHKEMFWRGDYHVWRNFLRHYLLTLLTTSAIFFTAEPIQFDPSCIENVIHHVPNDLPEAPIRETYRTICNAFFRHDAVEIFLRAMAARRHVVRKSELLAYFQIIHIVASYAVWAEFEKRGLLPTNESGKAILNLGELEAHATRACENIAKLVSATQIDEFFSSNFFEATETVTSQLALIAYYNGNVTRDALSWLLVAHHFPERYLAALSLLTHPKSYIACFSANPTNASMWGTYGDGHHGVCLKFLAAPAPDLGANLKLYRQIGSSGSKQENLVKIEPIHGFADHHFHKVAYTEAYPEIDFFRSLGSVSVQSLSQFWFRGQQGELSACHADMFDNEERWRKQHWEDFYRSVCNKTSEWAHEQEYRLILDAQFFDLKSPQSRKLRYRFADLAGIIFGIKTSTEDKLAIMKIIDKKCTEEARKDFGFYQMVYVRTQNRFEAKPLELMRHA